MTITALFDLIASGVTGAASAFVNLFSGLLPVFWNAPAQGETGAGSPTIVTILLVAGVVLTIGFWGIDKIFALSKLGLSGIGKARAKRSKRA